MSDEKHPGGRPTLYKPEYCQMLIDHMASGLSFETFGAVVDVNKTTLYEWKKNFAEFSDAVEMGFLKCQQFWEKLGVDYVINVSESSREGKDTHTSSKSLNGNVWKFNMQNRFKWKDKQPEEVSQVTVNNNSLNISDSELDEKIQKLLESKK